MRYVKMRDNGDFIEVSLAEHRDGVDVLVGDYIILTIYNGGYIETCNCVSNNDTGLEVDEDEQVVIYEEGEHDD